MQTVVFAAGWEHHAAPAATLLDALGPSMIWWGMALAMLAAGAVLLERRPRGAVILAVAASLALGIAVNGLVDDAYIQFRYAANLAAGQGPVFNPGERIEGASGGVWIALLALASRPTGIDPAVAGRLLSLAATALATCAAAALGRAIGGAPAAAMAALIWAALPTPALYAATGLETTAFAGVLMLLGTAVAGERSALAVFAGACVATLRPEGIILGLGALPFWKRLGRVGRGGLLSLLTSAALISLGRFLYYGLPVPRSALVKGVTAPAGIGSGLLYFGRALLEWWPLLLALPLVARQRGKPIPAIATAGAWTVLVVLRGGDWMPGGRYLLPLLAVLVGGAASLGWGRLGRGVVICSIVWGLLQLAPLERPSRSPVGGAWRAMAEHRVQSRWWESLGTWMRQSLPASTRLATGPAGALPYAAQLYAFDMYGLCMSVSGTREGVAGHRLWGLRDAIAAGTDIIYPGQSLPQAEEWPAVLEAARAQVDGAPGVLRRYQPLAISHPAEYHLDMVKDIVWVRPEIRPFQKQPQ